MPTPNLPPRDVSSLPVTAKLSIPGFPDWVTIDEERETVWVSNRAHGSVVRVDGASARVTAEIQVGAQPCSGLAVGHGSLWVPCCGDGLLVRVDLASNNIMARIAVAPADDEGGLAVDGRAVWMPTEQGTSLARVNPVSNTVEARIPLPPRSFAAAAGFGAVWVSCTQGNSVLRVDAVSNQVLATISVGASPRFLTAGLGAVWVVNQGDGTVSRLDPASNRATAVINVQPPGSGGDIATGEGMVWVTLLGQPLSRIDPATNEVTARYVGKGGDALCAGLRSVWLSSFGLRELWRIDPSQIK